MVNGGGGGGGCPPLPILSWRDADSFGLNLDSDSKAWFPYSCICRICRFCLIKKILTIDTTIWKPNRQPPNTTDTTDTTCCTRYKWFYLLQQIQQEMGVTRQHFVNGNHRKRLTRQIQQECVPECTSFRRCYSNRSNRYNKYNSMETQDT